MHCMSQLVSNRKYACELHVHIYTLSLIGYTHMQKVIIVVVHRKVVFSLTIFCWV